MPRIIFTRDHVTREAAPRSFRAGQIVELTRASAMHFIRRSLAQEIFDVEALPKRRGRPRKTEEPPETDDDHRQYWTAPRLWPGETCVVMASGPSMSATDAAYVRGKARTIVVNTTYKLAPWADVLYARDPKWWRWFDGAQDFQGLKITSGECNAWTYCLRDSGSEGFDPDPSALRHGNNSGYQAVHLAAHFGVKRILMLGFDHHQINGRTHWHPEHKVPTDPIVFGTVMLPKWPSLAEGLRNVGIDVVNCTPESAIKCFPKGRLRDIL